MNILKLAYSCNVILLINKRNTNAHYNMNDTYMHAKRKKPITNSDIIHDFIDMNCP